MINKLKQLTQNAEKERGQGLVEYALILVLVAVVSIVVLTQMGPAIGNVFSDVLGTFEGDSVAAADDAPAPEDPDPPATMTCETSGWSTTFGREVWEEYISEDGGENWTYGNAHFHTRGNDPCPFPHKNQVP